MKNIKITDTLIKAYLNDETTIEEDAALLVALKKEPSLKGVIASIREEMTLVHEQDDEGSDEAVVIPMTSRFFLPLTRYAATALNNECVLLCEQRAVLLLNKSATLDEMRTAGTAHGWLKETGVRVADIGQMLRVQGLSVARKFDCRLEDIKNELQAGCVVIAVVNSKVLQGLAEHGEPDHAVLVEDIELNKKTNRQVAVLFNPGHDQFMYDVADFVRAWQCSACFMVSVIAKRKYKPHPIDVKMVKLPADVESLSEDIAKDVHDVWVTNRRGEGWKYGEIRNDAEKTHPNIIDYEKLPEKEKEYDRRMALQTLKLLYRVNYHILPPVSGAGETMLTEEIKQLIDVIAENAHDIWAADRMKEGWTCGSDSNSKQNPFLKPYSELTEEQQRWDRDTVEHAITFLLKRGYQIVLASI